MKDLSTKKAYLFDNASDIIAERDRMESNWCESMRSRMVTLSMIYRKLTGGLLSQA